MTTTTTQASTFNMHNQFLREQEAIVNNNANNFELLMNNYSVVNQITGDIDMANISNTLFETLRAAKEASQCSNSARNGYIPQKQISSKSFDAAIVAKKSTDSPFLRRRPFSSSPLLSSHPQMTKDSPSTRDDGVRRSSWSEKQRLVYPPNIDDDDSDGDSTSASVATRLTTTIATPRSSIPRGDRFTPTVTARDTRDVTVTPITTETVLPTVTTQRSASSLNPASDDEEEDDGPSPLLVDFPAKHFPDATMDGSGVVKDVVATPYAAVDGFSKKRSDRRMQLARDLTQSTVSTCGTSMSSLYREESMTSRGRRMEGKKLSRSTLSSTTCRTSLTSVFAEEDIKEEEEEGECDGGIDDVIEVAETEEEVECHPLVRKIHSCGVIDRILSAQQRQSANPTPRRSSYAYGLKRPDPTDVEEEDLLVDFPAINELEDPEPELELNLSIDDDEGMEIATMSSGSTLHASNEDPMNEFKKPPKNENPTPQLVPCASFLPPPPMNPTHDEEMLRTMIEAQINILSHVKKPPRRVRRRSQTNDDFDIMGNIDIWDSYRKDLLSDECGFQLPVGVIVDNFIANNKKKPKKSRRRRRSSSSSTNSSRTPSTPVATKPPAVPEPPPSTPTKWFNSVGSLVDNIVEQGKQTLRRNSLAPPTALPSPPPNRRNSLPLELPSIQPSSVVSYWNKPKSSRRTTFPPHHKPQSSLDFDDMLAELDDCSSFDSWDQSERPVKPRRMPALLPRLTNDELVEGGYETAVGLIDAFVSRKARGRETRRNSLPGGEVGGELKRERSGEFTL